LCQVIDDGVYGRHKRWFDPSTQLYARDLDWARDMAAQREDLRRLWRWSLLRVSLTSNIDNWPEELFAALVYLGRQQEALSRVELLSDVTKKVRIFCTLARMFPPEEAQLAWDRAQTLAENSDNAEQCAAALIALATSQMEAQHPAVATTCARAFTAIARMEQSLDRDHAIHNLTSITIQAQLWDSTRAAINSIQDDIARIELLTMLAVAQAEVQHPDAQATFTQAFTSADQLHEQNGREAALSMLAVAQAQAALWDAVHATIAHMRNDWVRAEALIRLATVQTERQHPDAFITLTLAHTATTAITGGRNKAKAMHDLVTAYEQAGFWTEADQLIAEMPNEIRSAAVLTSLAVIQAKAQHPDAQKTFARAVTTAEKIPVEFLRRSTFGDIAVAMASVGMVHEASTTIDRISEAESRDPALRYLARAYAQLDLWDAVRSTFLRIADTRMQTDALRDVTEIQIMAQRWDMAAATAAAIEDSKARAAVLSSLAAAQAQTRHPSASTTFALARATVEARPDDSARGAILRLLATSLAQAGRWDEAWNALAKIGDAEARTWALIAVAMAQADGANPDARATFILAHTAAESIDDPRVYPKALRMLAMGQVHAGYWEDAQATIQGIDEDWMSAEVLTMLAVAQAESGAWDEVRITIDALTTTESQVTAIRALVHCLAQAGQWDQARSMVADCTEPVQPEALVTLAMELAQAGLWENAHSTIDSIADAAAHTTAVIALAAAQLAAQHPEAGTTLARAQTLVAQLRTETQHSPQQEKASTIEDMLATISISSEQMLVHHTHMEVLNALANVQTQAGRWDDAQTTIDALDLTDMRTNARQTLALALIEAGFWERAHDTIKGILNPVARVEALSALAVAQTQEHHPDASATFALAQTIAEGVNDIEVRATALQVLHRALLSTGTLPEIRRSSARQWQRARTARALHILGRVVTPLMFSEPLLGEAMVAAFDWLDEHLHDELHPV
jgi:tetratricopeptide (TPR) repeat protein